MTNHSNLVVTLTGIVDRVTYHNESSGWSVLKVSSFQDPGKLMTVLIHQEKVFPGATIEFKGNWIHHAKFGEQFKAINATEKKPATTAALEKYLGSGLIEGVGPATAKKIVKFFKNQTLEVFENNIDALLEVPGIAEKKLKKIRQSWDEHKSIREVMMLLQEQGLSTLYAVKIFKTYQDKSIEVVKKNPYRLANDIYGIGFFTADKIALNMGFERRGEVRIEAGIKHVLQASREQGHCYLTDHQIQSSTHELLEENDLNESILNCLEQLKIKTEIKVRQLNDENCYYSKSLYFDELNTSLRIKTLLNQEHSLEAHRVKSWVTKYCQSQDIKLSDEQQNAVCEIAGKSFSVLTGGPGCGKTTTTKVLVKLLQAMNLSISLAAPTGRAAQRMTEVIGMESKTIHRLLEWSPGDNDFKKNEDYPLETNFLIIDECSMLDITLTAKLLKAVANKTQILFIGDPDQLPAVGAGNVLKDLLEVQKIPSFRLTKIFRQAEASSIIRFAHQINRGEVPQIESPIHNKNAFLAGIDCLFIDSDEATKEQITFLTKAKAYIQREKERAHEESEIIENEQIFEDTLIIPEKFKHVDLDSLSKARNHSEELLQIIKKVHPWSTLHYGLNALETILRLYTKTIPDWFSGRMPEIQILCPQIRGSVGSAKLNQEIQAVQNPVSRDKNEIRLGDRILRVGDRVIQTKNNYDLAVFNGDIGNINSINNQEMSIEVIFPGIEERRVLYKKEDIIEISLAYAVTVHKSQGSEFEVIIIPVVSQHFNMLFRNLIYTGVTRAKKLAVFVGSRKALAMAIKNQNQTKRQTALKYLLELN